MILAHAFSVSSAFSHLMKNHLVVLVRAGIADVTRAAAQMEKDLAEDLHRAGYTVTGGH